jgi:hypothetical protein
MTKLLEEAIAKVRELPEEEQDAAAEALFVHMAGTGYRCRLAVEQVEEVKRRQRDFRDGIERNATDEEIDEVWRRSGR